ncbi:MAG: iron-sulfur cluster assembly scaffold protein [Candidatus Moranbacteria bacterium]|nr:iron-sulfur cluster assembly scaffold protein [Candidatus Moranbacteria bacterium]
MYSNLVLKHFTNPKNQGRLKNPDGVGMVGNPACGDIMTVYIKVKHSKEKDVISDIKFETLGCAAAIATSSMVTQMAKGKNLHDAERISRGDIADSLEGLPPAKMHCSNLAADALKRAIEDFRSKSSKKTRRPAGTKKRTRRR